MRLVNLWLNNFKLVFPNTKYRTLALVGSTFALSNTFFFWLCQPPTSNPHSLPLRVFFKLLNSLYLNYGIWYGSMGLMVPWFCDSVVLLYGGESVYIQYPTFNIRAYIYILSLVLPRLFYHPSPLSFSPPLLLLLLLFTFPFPFPSPLFLPPSPLVSLFPSRK